MTLSLKDVLSAKTYSGHLLLAVLLVILFVGLLIILIFPLFFWFVFGEGATADRISGKPISILLGDLLPILFGIAFCMYRLVACLKAGEAAKAKSYLIAAFILLLVYPFRLHIINSVIEVCTYVSDRL